MPQKVCLYKYMTVSEQLQFFGRIYQIDQETLHRRIGELLQILKLEEYENTRIANLSMGQQRRISLICALIHFPKLILL